MKISDINYPKTMSAILEPSKYKEKFDDLRRYALLASEFGYDKEAKEFINRIDQFIADMNEEFNAILENPKADPDEPETLEEIHMNRLDAKHRLIDRIPEDYTERWLGSFLGRGAGCTLGAGLEFQSVSNMEKWAKHFGDEFPLTDYWSHVKSPDSPRYIVGNSTNLTKGNMDCIPVDDDTAYSLIGLLTIEKYGQKFSHQDMADLWRSEIPMQSENGSWGLFWGERRLVKNLNIGIDVKRAGYYMNPNVQSVAAWTRADTWGYVAPGWPEKAAELAYKDASINHRRNGVYGSMFMAAAVSAAFVVGEPIEAIKIALNEIPQKSMMAEAVKWALSIAPQVKNYKDAVEAVTSRYAGMFEGHAINNALYVIFGIIIGGRDFTKVIGETVAMGFDNDCTGATAGSIVGAVIGKQNIPKHWYEPFNNRVQCYFNNCPRYIDIDELERRYRKQAGIIFK